MGFNEVIQLILGLSLFLYGMNIMGDGLERISGGRLERTLEKMTNNRFKGLLLGTAVTGVIQSSSATTVMVVGFVNSGIMKLKQAVGIIMGANIGTTVTAWILSLTGIEGDNFFLTLCKPTTFSPILAGIGIVLIMFTKSSKNKNIASIMLGFAILMLGMDQMSASVEGLAEVPAFTNILLIFGENPILGILAGAVLTGIIQSSSASVGILQALSLSVGITYNSTIPIIMGMNIGTCVTALISCIGAKKNAKRAAFVHLYFNVIGTVIWSAVYLIVNSLIHIEFFTQFVSPAEIATITTIFNVLTTLLLFPFAGVLEKLACATIRDKEEESNLPFLDERFLETPSIATEQCKEMAYKMAELCKESYIKAMDLIGNYNDKVFNEIVEEESLVDTYEDVLGSYLVKLASKDLNGNDSREISKILLCINDFERISDHAVLIAKSAKEMHEKQIMFSDIALREITVMKNALSEVVSNTVNAFATNSTDLASQVEPLEQVVDKLQEKIRARHIKRLKDGKCTVELGFIHADIITSFQRVSDHCSNVAVCIIQINLKQFETHEYLQELKSSDSDFKEDYNEYKIKYALPEVDKA